MFVEQCTISLSSRAGIVKQKHASEHEKCLPRENVMRARNEPLV